VYGFSRVYISHFTFVSLRLWRIGAVKATEFGAPLRVAKAQIPIEGVDPDGQPVHHIGRSFNDHNLPCRPGEIEAELPTTEAET